MQLRGERRRYQAAADREIGRLAVPAFGALLAEPLFLLADSAIVGRLGTPQLAGLGVASAILMNAVYLCVFLAFGTTGSVARRVGAGDLSGALGQGVAGLWLAGAIGMALSGIGWLLTPGLVAVFGLSPEAALHAETYLSISLFGLPSMLIMLAATGLLRGLNDTRTPLLVASTAAFINVPLSVTLVFGAGLGISGAAFGTVVAQLGASVWLVLVVVRAARTNNASLGPNLSHIREAAARGFPLLLRTIFLRIALLGMTFAAAAQGDVEVASHQVAFTLWSLSVIVPNSLAIAAQAMVGKRLGAADIEAARAVAKRMVAWGLCTGVALGLAIAVLRPVYVPLFSTDPAVRELLSSVLLVVAVLQPIGGIFFVLDGVLIGAGDGRYLAVASLVTLLIFLPLAGLVLLTHAGLVALWWALAVYTLARMTAVTLRGRSDHWLITGATR